MTNLVNASTGGGLVGNDHVPVGVITLDVVLKDAKLGDVFITDSGAEYIYKDADGGREVILRSMTDKIFEGSFKHTVILGLKPKPKPYRWEGYQYCTSSNSTDRPTLYNKNEPSLGTVKCKVTIEQVFE